MNNYGYIYETINSATGMLYVGKHKGAFESWYHGGGTRINRAIKKYGKKAFTTRPIAYARTKDELNELEVEHIAKYKATYGADKLYNISEGGDGGGGLTRHSSDCVCCFCMGKRGELSGSNCPRYGKTYRYVRNKATGERRMIAPEMLSEYIIAGWVRCSTGSRVGKNNGMYGRRHTEKARKGMKENRPDQSGKSNGMFGVHRYGSANPMFGKSDSAKRGWETRRKNMVTK